ncbi:MAG TPA: response regulator [Thermoflexia bacterium]|nr:response regulator [Thermoflexia bacterium]
MKNEKTNAAHKRREGRILIVDDDVDFALSLVDILESRGYQVEIAHSAQAAQEKVQDFDAQVALLDVRLRRTSGIDLIASLEEIRPGILCVTMTAYAAMDTAIEAIRRGAYDYLQKPLNIQYLLASLERCFEKLWLESEKDAAEKTLRQRNRELGLLNRVGRALNSTLELSQVLVAVLEGVRRLLNIVACSIWLIEPETNELVCQQTIGPHSEVVRGWRLAPGEGLAGWVAHSGESLIVPDTQADERYFEKVDQQTGLALRSVLGIPLRVKDNVIGVLQVTDSEVDRFRPADLALVEALAASAASAIDNAWLVESLRERTTELQARNKELDAYAHTVAHDLKGPLGPIVGFAQVLAEDYATIPPQEARRYLYTIAQNGRKIGSIIDELLLMSGLRNIETIEMEPLDMASIVGEAQQRLFYEIEESQAEILLPDAWPAALGYGPWVEEVWVNYLSNGIKYGGRPEENTRPRIKLGFDEWANGRTANGEPDTDAISDSQFAHSSIRFWVRDNGPGLTPDERARLFTPFTRLGPKGGGEDYVRGYGLGLSIVRRIVEKLGGQVGVESKVGAGSMFWFTLPAQRG